MVSVRPRRSNSRSTNYKPADGKILKSKHISQPPHGQPVCRCSLSAPIAPTHFTCFFCSHYHVSLDKTTALHLSLSDGQAQVRRSRHCYYPSTRAFQAGRSRRAPDGRHAAFHLVPAASARGGPSWTRSGQRPRAPNCYSQDEHRRGGEAAPGVLRLWRGCYHAISGSHTGTRLAGSRRRG